jgi:hypothetical protein
VSDQGFIGETEACLQVVLGGRLQSVLGEFSARGSRGKLVLGVSYEECFCEERICVYYLECVTVAVSMLKSVARRRLVEPGYLTACATSNCSCV